jgi:hypothetical protein
MTRAQQALARVTVKGFRVVFRLPCCVSELHGLDELD